MRKLLLTILLLSGSVSASDLPIVVDPVVNATPPGATVTAGYVTFINESDKTISITDAFSPTIAKVEIHLSTVKDDVAKMEKQDSVQIPSGGTLKFEHGGYHFMLMGLTEPLKENATVDIILTTSAGDILIEMPVKKIGQAKAMHKAMEHTGSTKVVH